MFETVVYALAGFGAVVVVGLIAGTIYEKIRFHYERNGE